MPLPETGPPKKVVPAGVKSTTPAGTVPTSMDNPFLAAGGPSGNDSPLKSHKKRIITVEVPTPPRARWFDRTLASLIDMAILLTPLVISVLIAASASPDARSLSIALTIVSGVLGTVGVFIGQVFLEGVMGQTLGKMILGIVVVDASNGELIGLNRAFTRNFIKFVLDIAPLGTGIVSMARDEDTVKTRADDGAHTAVLYSIRRAPIKYAANDGIPS